MSIARLAGSRRRTLWAAALAMLCAIAVALPMMARAGATVTVESLSEALTCQCGCGLTVANCNHPNCEFSVPVRAQIGEMLKRGMSGPQIIAFFRNKYGEKILSSPTTQGFNLLAWIMPFAAILAGGALVAVTVGRWRGRSPASGSAPDEQANGTADHEPFDAELRRRLERELRERI